MKLSDCFLFLVVGIFGVYLGYSLLPITDALLFKKLDTGDLATWFAAAGTILTLAFLINQHMQLKSMQDTERADRENHEKKQQEMWQEQKEMLSFQKFQVHKEEFNKLLDQLEKNFPKIKFNDRIYLYQILFPGNDFMSSSVKLRENSTLLELVEHFKKTMEIEDKHSPDFYYSSVKSIIEAQFLYDFKSSSNPLGSYQETAILAHTGFSIFSVYDYLLMIETITDAILRFACSGHFIPTLSAHNATTNAQFRLLNTFLFNEKIITKLNLGSGHYAQDYLLLLYSIASLWHKYRAQSTHKDHLAFDAFSRLFDSQTSVEKLMNDRNLQKQASLIVKELKVVIDKNHDDSIKLKQIRDNELYNKLEY